MPTRRQNYVPPHTDPSGFPFPGPTADRGPTKDDLRRLAAAAQSAFAGNIERLPTVVELRCPRCRHTGKAMVADGDSRRFRCKNCSHRL